MLSGMWICLFLTAFSCIFNFYLYLDFFRRIAAEYKRDEQTKRNIQSFKDVKLFRMRCSHVCLEKLHAGLIHYSCDSSKIGSLS